MNLNTQFKEKSLKDLLLVEPIYLLIKDSILETTKLTESDFKSYSSDLLLKVIQTYISEFLNLLYSDVLCQNPEVFKLYKELKERDSLKVVPIEQNKREKDLSLKDLLFGNQKE